MAKKYLTNKEIIDITELSFFPLCCKAHLTDYGNNLRFKVLDENKNIIVETNEIDVNSIDKKELESIIYPYKEIIKNKRFSLD